VRPDQRAAVVETLEAQVRPIPSWATTPYPLSVLGQIRLREILRQEAAMSDTFALGHAEALLHGVSLEPESIERITSALGDLLDLKESELADAIAALRSACSLPSVSGTEEGLRHVSLCAMLTMLRCAVEAAHDYAKGEAEP
jgi:hypothetical protein